MKRIGVLTSGGDAPGMNAAVRAVVRGAIYNGMEVYGIEQGYEGLINGAIRELGVASVADTIQRGGTFLRTARSEAFRTKEGFAMALSMLKNFEIEGLVVVGGDGSLHGGLELSKAGITVMGLPGTIDNDLAYTEYTIGFDTAVNTALNAIANIRDTSSSHGRGTVVEVMGRNCGDIALHAGLAGGAEVVLIPEEEPDISAICRKLVEGRNRGKRHSLIIRAEGASIGTEELVKIIQERTGIEIKAVVLGYVQRGGAPTARDRLLASQTAYRAVELLMAGSGSRAIGIQGSEIVDYDLAEALAMKSTVDPKLVSLANILSI
ncbi:MAG: 6-phosphofructokinase [Firmicutes bacterium]|nr:6-phosphofructokinase [Bacillota bacterium]